ncbi:MAG: Fic family protein, partial [Eubacteriales bacterium]|nr:Fic family protein [Eubacteriales bacterium]
VYYVQEKGHNVQEGRPRDEKYKEMRLITLENPGNSAEVEHVRSLRYASEATLRFPFQVGEYPAFVMQSTELAALISSIYRKNRELERLCTEVPKGAVEQFNQSTMVEEIQQTNEVENVHSTRREIRDAVARVEQGQTGARFDGMVRKYNMLLAHKPIPLEVSADVRRLYNEFILDEVVRENPKNAPDGVVFRKDPTSVYSEHDQKLHEGLYPESKIMEAMEQSLAMLNNEEIDPLIRAAAFHYMFAYIHPFYDGNGRMTRFISSYVLSRSFCEAACLRIAYVIKDHRKAYYRLFKEANDKRSRGDLTRFVTEFLRFFEQALDEATASLAEKNERYRRYYTLLTSALAAMPKVDRWYRVMLQIMLQEELFGHPRFDMQRLARLADHNERTVRSKLEKSGGLVRHEIDGKKYWWRINLEALGNGAENE